MDGVIADTNPHHLITWGEYARRYFNHELTEEEFARHVSGRTNAAIVEYLLKGETLPVEEVIRMGDAKEALFREVYAPHAAPVPGLIPFLKELKAAGIKTAVATSAPPENLTFMVEALGLEPYFDLLLDVSRVTHPKPHPEIYLLAMAGLGVEPSEAVVFEDSIPGIQAGLASGAKVVGLATTHQPEELTNVSLVVRDFTELRLEQLMDMPVSERSYGRTGSADFTEK